MSWLTDIQNADIAFTLSRSDGILKIKDRYDCSGKSSIQELLSSVIKFENLSNVEKSILEKTLIKLKKLDNFS